MSFDAPQFQAFQSRAAADAAVTKIIASTIESSVAANGQAVILLSGGSTPGPAYALLSQQDLAWNKTAVGLVDDRWVPETDDGSNAAMIRRVLIQGQASQAKFIPMVPAHAKPQDGTAEIEQRMSGLTRNPDLCLLGMGTDGHTASWFPGSQGLAAAMDIDTPQTVAAIDAKGCAVAGKHPDRITLTLPAVMRASKLVLFITGDEKRRVWEDSKNKSVYGAPVTALRAAGQRLTIIWAP